MTPWRQGFSRCFLYVFCRVKYDRIGRREEDESFQIYPINCLIILLLKMQHDAPKSLDKSKIHGSDKLRSCVQSWKINALSRYDLVRNGCSCSGNTTKGQNFDVDRNLVKDGNR